MSESEVQDFVAIRHDIHRHPELAYEEHRTAALVAERLRAWGYTVTEGLGGTGVVGQLTRGSGLRCLGLRADMDALPITEASGVPWTSERAGVMHACGHDGHTAMLLAAARHLAEHGDFSGTLNLIFQPAEEGGGGARRMMVDGLFERFPCDAIYAMHNMPGIEQGRLVFRTGPFMASSDYVCIHLQGKGGHGAMPHLAADPVVAGASVVMALQTVVSRNVPPLETAVITIGSFQAGQANNVIPDSAKLELSVRALSPAVRELLEQRIKTLVTAQAASYGLTAEVEWRHGYPVLVNTEAETAFAAQVAMRTFGQEQVELMGPMQTGSEDFAFMLQQVPGSYLLIGNGGQPGTPGACMVHNPGYDFNDNNIGVGASYWIALAEAFLKS